jgi:glutathione S-transferase
MSDFTLTIGNKNYSSWSLRPWLTLKQTGVAFREIVIPLYGADSPRAIREHSPSGKVPVLRHGDNVVWDSLAICEYLAETFPEARLWPADPAARAVARSISAEMHSGFAALRTHMGMNVRARLPGKGRTIESLRDIDRVRTIWRETLDRFGKGGAFLFGSFSIADAMYAPVVFRFRTYEVDLDARLREYCAAILSLPAIEEWGEAALVEPWTIEAFEYPEIDA